MSGGLWEVEQARDVLGLKPYDVTGNLGQVVSKFRGESMTKHVHAELMMQYAQDALETDTPWERWEFSNRTTSEWWGCEEHPMWSKVLVYRRKPKTRTVNGFTFEWEEGGDNGYIAHPIGDNFFLFAKHSKCAIMRAKERNLLAKTKEMAIAHAKAMLGIDPNEEQTASYAVRSE